MPRRSEGRLPPKDSQCADLGHRFRSTRERRGLTLSAVAAGTELCVNTIRRHEAGNMMLRSDDLLRAAVALGVTAAELLGERDYGTDTAAAGD